MNFNIHAEILADANEFLNTYDLAILDDEEKMRRRKERILEILNEIEALIQMIGGSAIQGDMYYGKRQQLEQLQRELNDLEDEDRKATRIKMGDPEDDNRLQ